MRAHRPRVGLYVHLPFCPHRCCYCDFAIAVIPPSSRRRNDLVARYLRALQREAETWQGQLLACTLYFGGGTPSFLRPEELEPLLSFLRCAFALPPEAEVTLEANPGTVAAEDWRLWRELGINRLSLGVQAFQDEWLRWMRRGHTAAEAAAACRAAQEAGFDNINLDLIYGLPGQTREQWQATLRQAVALEPQHLSLYSLTVEPQTPLQRWIQRGRQAPPDDDLAADMYEWALDFLGEAGYEPYELSNFARPGFHSRHNCLYWRNEPYLGLGTSAASFLGGVRWSNAVPWREYLRRMEAGLSPVAQEERLDEEGQMRETLILALRMREGVSEREFYRRFGTTLETLCGPTLERLAEWGLLERKGDAWRLTRRGMLLANVVFRELL